MNNLREALDKHWNGVNGNQLGWDQVEVIAVAARRVLAPITDEELHRAMKWGIISKDEVRCLLEAFMVHRFGEKTE